MEPTAPASEPASGVEAAHRAPWLALLGVALVPSVLALWQLGRIHPDEVYQALEPAYFRAHGYGVLAWEWQVGLRNWAVPLFFSWLLRLSAVFGIHHPLGYRAVLEVPQLGLTVWALWATYRYAERRAGHFGGLASVALLGFYGAWLVFAGRTMGESFSAAFLVIALEALDRPEPRRAGLLAGAALGLSVVA
ncbi:MAG TPA: mannosyltransferase, partial [Myxococcaceae bacterium]|nr:mannosyltransferase [Myxococcaceae bacterium]